MNVSGVGCRWGGINHGRLPGHARRNHGGRTHTERRVVWPRYAAAFIKKAGGERAGRHTWHNEWLPIFLRRGLFLGINSTIGERDARCVYLPRVGGHRLLERIS